MRAKLVTATLSFLIVLALNTPGAQQPGPVYDKDLRVVEFQELQYPAIGRSAEIEGVVVVRAKLDSQGNVVDAAALSGPEPLIPDCLANIKKWRFTPNASSAAIVVYNFRLINGIFKNAVSQFILDPPNFVTITASLPRIQVEEKTHPAARR